MINEEGQGGYTGAGADAIGAAIIAGANLYDSHQNRKTAKRNTDATIAANKAEAELAYQRQVQMWNMQNMYNSPQSQMQRFMQAGLNPHLIYGQGNAGNATSSPQYNPPNIQYRYESGNFGAAAGSFLPTLMAVGTWLQNMRAQEVQIRKDMVGTESTELGMLKTQQLMDYLREKNPQLLKEGENRLSLFSTQKDMARYQASKAYAQAFGAEQDIRQRFGDELFQQMGSSWQSEKFAPIGGTAKQEYLMSLYKNASQQYQNKILEAKSSWTDLNITDPQAIIQLVMSGIMGMAGMQLRKNVQQKAAPVQQKTRPTGLRRVHPARRVQAKPKGYYD